MSLSVSTSLSISASLSLLVRSISHSAGFATGFLQQGDGGEGATTGGGGPRLSPPPSGEDSQGGWPIRGDIGGTMSDRGRGTHIFIKSAR